MSANEKADGSVRAVGRALEILLAFAAGDYELTAAELLKRVDLSRPTLYRLLHTLQEFGFIDAVGEPQRFRLGRSVAQLSHVWSSGFDLARIAFPIMERLRDETQETVALFIPQGNRRLCIAELPSPQPLSFKRGVGYSELIYRGASGRAILAAMNLNETGLRTLLDGDLTNSKELAAELKVVRQNGFCSSHNELIKGAVAVAMPFFDHTNTVIGSVAVFGPDTRLTSTAITNVVRFLSTATADLTTALGGSMAIAKQ